MSDSLKEYLIISLSLQRKVLLINSLSLSLSHTHTHTQPYLYLYNCVWRQTLVRSILHIILHNP
ncbi:hypothetical protein HanHA300_Chr16g0610801 [Helianthus annuus]|nr:hypothetical protein HanHA300_Chr16g0610801 [Helianthus annuus]